MQNKIEELIKKLTLEEKIGMIHGNGLFCTKGVERLGILPLTMSDGPMGVRYEFEKAHWIPCGKSDDYVTYLPCNSALASTWNRQVAYVSGQVLGEEARGRGKDVILAPGINIKRSPLCGRNFEYMSEDPYLTGEMAVPLIKGIQEADTAACVKHFAMNNQETERLNVEVEVSDRAMREIYLPAFQKAVQEGSSYSLMGAYNRFRGEHCCESKFLLNTILREEWQYDGMVVSDWGAVHCTKEAAISGLDIEMSVFDNFDDYCMAQPLKSAVEAGEIEETWIDEKIRNILRLLFRIHKLGDEPRKKGSYNTPEHRRAVLEASKESIVLLKNEENHLPLVAEKVKKVLIIGDNAVRIHSNGGGSAEIKALYEITPLMGIKKLLGGNAEVTWVPGYETEEDQDKKRDINWQADSLENADVRMVEEIVQTESERQQDLRKEAVRLASEYEEVIFIGGLNHRQDLEGQDRPDMKLPYHQDKLIKEVLEVNPQTIVVMFSGSPVEMKEWVKDTKTLVWSWYNGMEGGTALADVLFGNVNPSGRLPETFPLSHMDCSAHSIGEFSGEKSVSYREGIYVGYRHYDTRQIPVLFPFGYGLSYTEFKYKNLKIQQIEVNGQFILKVMVDITNTGKKAGKEVVQLYIGKTDSEVDRPLKELKGFDKILLQIQETKTVCFELSKENLAYYDVKAKVFIAEPGEYQVYIGKSVRDICLESSFTLLG